MTLWRWRPGPGAAPSVHPPPLTPRDDRTGERGRLGTKSTRLHTSRRYPRRVEAALADEREHDLDRTTRRMIRRAIAKIVAGRAAELGHPACGCDPRRCRHLPALWAAWHRRLSSCDFAKPFRNALTGTEIAFPFSCRVPGCPHCEGERVDELRRRFVPLVEAADRPRVAYLTTANVPAGGLAPGWSAIGAAFARLWRSPLFAGAVETCRTPKQRAARGHVADSAADPCHGHRRYCRPGKVGCLAAVAGAELELRRWCAGRCQRLPRHLEGLAEPVRHPACRPCPGHRPATAALLALETTVNRRTSTWHPHANLLFAGDFIPKRTLDAAWAAALRVTTAHTWIRDATKAPPGHRGDWSVRKAVYETVKYAIKPDADLLDSAAPSWYVEWAEARRGRRLVRSYGDWYGVADVDDDAGPAEETVPVTDDDGRTYRLPRLDPITDDVADWVLLPGDAPRASFLRVQPPDSAAAPRRPWLVRHPTFARELGDGWGDVPDG